MSDHPGVRGWILTKRSSRPWEDHTWWREVSEGTSVHRQVSRQPTRGLYLPAMECHSALQKEGNSATCYPVDEP